MDEMTMVPLFTVKQPGAATPAHFTNVDPVPADNWADVPIWTDVTSAMPVPAIVTRPPPAVDPTLGLIAVIVAAAGLVPAVLLLVYPARPVSDDDVTTDADCTVAAVTVVVATAVTVTGGSEEP